MDASEITPLLRRQHGLVTIEQLRRHGIGRGAVARAVQRGQLVRRHPGVYSVTPHETREARWLAAVLASGATARLSHLSGAGLWGWMVESPGPVHVTVLGSRHGSPGIHLHRSRTAGRPVTRHGIPVSAALETLIDLADIVDFDTLLTAAMEADHRRHVDLRRLAPVPGRPGTGRIQRLLARVVEGTRSDFEARMRELCIAAGLPMPLANARVHGFRPDLSWPEHRVAVEMDSYEHHSSRRAFHRDRRRDAQLRARGWTVLRFGWWQLEDHPGEVIAAVRAALGV